MSLCRLCELGFTASDQYQFLSKPMQLFFLLGFSETVRVKAYRNVAGNERKDAEAIT